MRIDQQLDPAALGINERQHFFLGAWFNLVHQHSLDSYRVRVMNPVNILRELRRMFDPPANDDDCKVVASEALEILDNHPVIIVQAGRYVGFQDTMSLISEALQAKDGFKRDPLLLRSFMRELEASLASHFLEDCFAWLEASISAVPAGETPEQRACAYGDIEKVCRDMLSVAHDEGISLESLFHLYRLFVPPQDRASPSGPEAPPTLDAQHQGAAASQSAPYNFAERFGRVRGEILAAPREHRLTFLITGCTPSAIPSCCGEFGPITISEAPPELPEHTPPKVRNLFSHRPRRLFAQAAVTSRDARSAGLDAYRQIGRILDLMRFEYDTPQIHADSRFLFHDEDKYRLIEIPQMIPNPEAEPPTRTLPEFVAHLSALAARDPSQTEASDRIFSAFRLYRLGTGTNMFDNKLVNWWTGLEYLTSGSKAGSAIGERVKNALAPTLALTYLPKHLAAFRSALATLDIEVTSNGAQVPVRECSNAALYASLKDGAQRNALEARLASNPFLWKHLSSFIANVSSPAKTAEMLKAHDRRVRWQIERIYRARGDIVHAAKQTVMASLLCANLEFYLRTTLRSMLKVFSSVPTLVGPAEFFERQRHQFGRILQRLESRERDVPASDALIVAMLD